MFVFGFASMTPGQRTRLERAPGGRRAGYAQQDPDPGKWVSHGILFDVNSDRIKGESYGSLKEIAGVLTENADLRVLIVGHTDSDGDTAANLDLSKTTGGVGEDGARQRIHHRAARMDTDGKGEGEPVDKNETPAGKANNRRVEFIKK